MPEDTRGFKRRLSDADASERITQRQMILNMSICKLQKDHGRKEPRLLRSLLIANTVRLIEQEMEEEENQYNTFKGEDLLDSFESAFSDERDWVRLECIPTHDEDIETEIKNPEELRASFADIGTDIIPSAKKMEAGLPFAGSGKSGSVSATSDGGSKFGAIGDHRKLGSKGKDDELNMMTYDKTKDCAVSTYVQMPALALTLDLQMPVLSVPLADSYDTESCFSDLEMASYDFDFVSSPLLSQLCDDWKSLDGFHAGSGPMSCASEVEKKRGDSFFDELDQIMQVLVGM